MHAFMHENADNRNGYAGTDMTKAAGDDRKND